MHFVSTAQTTAPASAHPDTTASPARLSVLLLAAAALYAVAVATVMLVAALLPPSILFLRPEQYDSLSNAIVGHLIASAIFAGAALWVRRGVSRNDHLPKALLAILSTAAVLSFDRIVDVLDPAPPSKKTIFEVHPERGWSHRRGIRARLKTRVRIDEHGMRVAEDGPIRTIHDKTRFLFLGDSVTFGYGLPARQSYGERAVALLNRRHPKLNAAALNAGVTGYDLSQESHLLDHEALALDPAVVVLQICLNDVIWQFDRLRKPLSKRHTEFGQLTPPAYHWSGLGRLVTRAANHLRYGGSQKSATIEIEHFTFQELLEPQTTPRVERAWARLRQQFGRIVRSCRLAGVPIAVVYFPILDQVVDETVSVEPQRILAEMCESHGILSLNVLEVMEQSIPRGKRAGREFFFERTHPTESGNLLAARALVDLLEKQPFFRNLTPHSRAKDATQP